MNLLFLLMSFLSFFQLENPFGSHFFGWIDAGYGHGDVARFPSGFEWEPQLAEGKISIIKVASVCVPFLIIAIKSFNRRYCLFLYAQIEFLLDTFKLPLY